MSINDENGNIEGNCDIGSGIYNLNLGDPVFADANNKQNFL